VRAFEGGNLIENYLWNSRKILSALGRYVTGRLQDAGAHVVMPRGAFYLFPDFSPLRERLTERGITSSEVLCKRLLEDTGVAILPGTAFGRPAEELTARLAYVDFDGARALTAVSGRRNERLGATFLEGYCPKIVAGTEKLCQWLHG
jgi:aspartate aminotransferase